MSELHAFLDGVPVGSFAMSAGGNTTFAYGEAYRNLPTATPVSLSMRTGRTRRKAKAAGPFLAGRLPDSPERHEERRTVVARRSISFWSTR